MNGQSVNINEYHHFVGGLYKAVSEFILYKHIYKLGVLCIHIRRGCNENVYMSVGWRQQFPH